MTRFGLDIFLQRIPRPLHKARVGVLCHAASITSAYSHILDCLHAHPDCYLGAIFGPQHGLFGQTQDNMVEWEGPESHPVYQASVYSLYGRVRKPTAAMLKGLDALIIDLQDVGARPYTYIWTVKLCIEACAECGLPVWILDRPNPIGAIGFDGPLLHEDFYSFVGGAPIPLCHRLTIGELAMLIKQLYYPSAEVHVVWMDRWHRDSLWSDTGLPWALPSPNMPTLDTAIVYPGMVLLEATNLSEGRGTTRPFELFGAPCLDMEQFRRILFESELGGCIFREHGFIPTFQKWAGEFCFGMQIHVTNARAFRPALTTAAILEAAMRASNGRFVFKDPPYEYETEKLPFDILAGDSDMRRGLEEGRSLAAFADGWKRQRGAFLDLFRQCARYPEEPA